MTIFLYISYVLHKMTELIACLSTGKGTWAHVSRLMKEQEWEKIILFSNEFGKENFTADNKTEVIAFDTNKELKELRDDILKELKEKIKGTEVAVNFISGSGKEHMAFLGAILKLGTGIRLVALTKEGMEEI